MEAIFYITIFIIGALFGSFYTLAVYRIPKRQDILYTHSYCPNCNHKLGLLDLFPIISYISLGGKCRYCKEKIRPRYLILEILSGVFFVIISLSMGLSIYNLNVINIINLIFMVLYITFIILIAGIDKELRKMDKAVNIYGIVVAFMYMIYLCILGKASIYRYGIYLGLYILILLIEKTKKIDKYWTGILLALVTMLIFTGEYALSATVIAGVLAFVVAKEHMGFCLAFANIMIYTLILICGQYIW